MRKMRVVVYDPPFTKTKGIDGAVAVLAVVFFGGLVSYISYYFGKRQSKAELIK